MLININSVPQALITEDILHQKKREQTLINHTEVIDAEEVNFSEAPKFTRSAAKQKRQQQDIESLASLSSLVKSSKSKKLLPVHKQKQAAVELPERG